MRPHEGPIPRSTAERPLHEVHAVRCLVHRLGRRLGVTGTRRLCVDWVGGGPPLRLEPVGTLKYSVQESPLDQIGRCASVTASPPQSPIRTRTPPGTVQRSPFVGPWLLGVLRFIGPKLPLGHCRAAAAGVGSRTPPGFEPAPEDHPPGTNHSRPRAGRERKWSPSGPGVTELLGDRRVRRRPSVRRCGPPGRCPEWAW